MLKSLFVSGPRSNAHNHVFEDSTAWVTDSTEPTVVPVKEPMSAVTFTYSAKELKKSQRTWFFDSKSQCIYLYEPVHRHGVDNELSHKQ